MTYRTPWSAAPLWVACAADLRIAHVGAQRRTVGDVRDEIQSDRRRYDRTIVRDVGSAGGISDGETVDDTAPAAEAGLILSTWFGSSPPPRDEHGDHGRGHQQAHRSETDQHLPPPDRVGRSRFPPPEYRQSRSHRRVPRQQVRQALTDVGIQVVALLNISGTYRAAGLLEVGRINAGRSRSDSPADRGSAGPTAPLIDEVGQI